MVVTTSKKYSPVRDHKYSLQWELFILWNWFFIVIWFQSLRLLPSIPAWAIALMKYLAGVFANIIFRHLICIIWTFSLNVGSCWYTSAVDGYQIQTICTEYKSGSLMIYLECLDIYQIQTSDNYRRNLLFESESMMIYKCSGWISDSDIRYATGTYSIYLFSLCKSGSLMISVGGRRRPIVVSDQVSEPGLCTLSAISPKISLMMSDA